MPPEVESNEARIVRLETIQKTQERDIAGSLKVAEEAKEIAMEASKAVVQVNQTLAAMPGDIREAIREASSSGWGKANQWLALGVAIAAPFVAKWLGL